MRFLRNGLLAVLLFLPAAAGAQDHGRDMGHGDHALRFGKLLADQLEFRSAGAGALAWEVQGWYGGDDDKVRLKSYGEKPLDGRLHRAEVQGLYSRRVSDFFDAVGGLRYDTAPGTGRAFAVLGLHGLSPYFIETDAALFLSDAGDLSARLKGELSLPVTQRLILAPKAELNAALQSAPAHETGAGLGNVELGLRLRYELARELAPYVGLHWDRKLGETADLVRRDGGQADSLSWVAGIRVWF